MEKTELTKILEDHLKWTKDEEGGVRANLTGADLSRAYLTGADLTGANLTGANLTGANLTGANLTGANLTGANLTGANLYGADLYGANLTGAKYRNLTINYIKLFTYTCGVIRTTDDVWYVQMGCYTRTVDDWEKDFWNNEEEFPNDGSLKSKEREMAYKIMLQVIELKSLNEDVK
jgi:hypothetical protein